MRRYQDATALRRAWETRLKQESECTGGGLGRLRRRVVFDRLAVRLSVDDGTQWILTGGAALEFRAKATKDLDLAVTSGAADGLAVRQLLIDALTGGVPRRHDPRYAPMPGRYPRSAITMAHRLSPRRWATDTASDLPSALKLLRGFWGTAHDEASGTEH